MMIARVIDVETTGLPEDEQAEVIEMARIDVDVENRKVLSPTAWRSLCRPSGLISPGAKAQHHIIEEDVADAPPARELWDQLFDGMSSGDILVAHNAKFEQSFLPTIGCEWIDTYKIARVMWPDAPTHSNHGLRYWLDLDLDREQTMPPHRAAPDAYVTANLFARMLAEKRVEEMVRISQYPALVTWFRFGKHKGTKLSDVPFDYLQWIRDKSDMDEDMKWSANYWIKKRTRL